MKANQHISKLVAMGLLLGASALIAQDPNRERSDLLVGEMSSVGTESALERTSDETLGGGGAYYRVAFARGGMTFTPALGSHAERMHPLQLSLESIRRGNTTLHESYALVVPKLDGQMATYSRGAITERFEVRSEGVELSYVFPHRPSGSGDLVVRARVTTDLVTKTRRATNAPIRMTAEGIGGIEIGRVTGIDAVGNRRSGSMRFDGTHLELVLPERFVDEAVYPMTLDPLFGTVLNAGSNGNDDDDSDVAYESRFDEYVVVWRRSFAGANTEIRAQRIDGTTGAKIGGFLTITSNANVNSKPSIATVATTRRFLIAWQSGPSPFGPWDIECRGLNAGTTTLSTIVPVANSITNESSPDVGGERSSDDEAIVVWHDDIVGILASQVTLNSAGSDPFVFAPVTIWAGGGVSNPRISKSGGTAGRYLIVHDLNLLTPAVVGQCVNRNLGLIGSSLNIAVDTQLAEESADVDGDGSRFLCVWGETESGLIGDQDIYCRRVTCTATTSAVASAKTAVEADPNDDERDPAVAFLGPKYVVTWTAESGTFLETEIQGVSLDPANCSRCGFEFVIASTRDREESTEIASKWSSGSRSDDAMLACTSYDFSTGFFADVLVQQFSAVGPGSPVVDVGGGCGTGGSLTVAGSWVLTNQVSIDLAGTTGTIAALHIGGVGTSFACGPCTVTSPFIAIPVALAGGNASFPLRLRCSALDLVGGQWEMQYVSGSTGSSPCGFAPTVSFSNRRVATFGL